MILILGKSLTGLILEQAGEQLHYEAALVTQVDPRIKKPCTYDVEQRVTAVYQRVQRALAQANKRIPRNLEAMVERLLKWR